jgi:hypothetical protein
MFRFVLAFFLLLGQAFSLYAEPITIAKEDQVENFQDVGYCAWCCIETLGRHHRVKVLYDLVKNRRAGPQQVLVDYGGKEKKWHDAGPGWEWAIFNKLRELKVKFYYQKTGDKSYDLIKYAMENRLACMYAVGRDAWYKGSEAHAMIIVGFDDKEVNIIDPNHPGKSFIATRAWFDHFWTGQLVVILPPDTTSKIVTNSP